MISNTLKEYRTRDDPFRPAGYRFVLQFVDEPSIQSAAERLVRMLGMRANRAILMPATVDLGKWFRDRRWYTKQDGVVPCYRIYLPEKP